MKKFGTLVAVCSLASSAQAAWQFTEIKDPLTGKSTVRLSTLSKSPVTQFNRAFRPNLVVECQAISEHSKNARDIQMMASLQFPDRVAILEVTVRYEVDGGARTAFTVEVSDKGDTIFLSKGENDFIPQLRSGRRLRMEVGLRSSQVVVEFDIAGAAAAIAKLSGGKPKPDNPPTSPKTETQGKIATSRPGLQLDLGFT